MWLGAVGAYLALAGVDAWLGERRARAAAGSGEEALGERAAFLVALGIGLHNLGEGLAIGSAYAVGSLALGAALVVGFAIHNTTEGLAIVAPVARSGRGRPRTLVLLGLLAGAPAILGAWIGASAFNPSAGGAHVRHRRRCDRAGDRPDRPSDARGGRGAGSLRAWRPACCSAWS